MHPFIAALRQLHHPLVVAAIATLILQTPIAGLATAHAAVRAAMHGPDAIVFCHGNELGDPAGAGGGKAAHECCAFWTAAAPAALPAATLLAPVRIDSRSQAPRYVDPDVPLNPRAIRAGPSQAPPTHA